MPSGAANRRARRLSLGGLLLSAGLLSLAFLPGVWGVGGAVLFAVEVALIVIGAVLLWSARRR